MVGLESALSVVHAAMVADERLDWADVARVMSAKPAEIGSLGGYADGLVVGAPANVTLYDPEAGRTFSREDLAGKGVNSPYLGLELPGRVVHTFHRGRPTVADGELVAAEEVAHA
jgi:dihydroorotase